MSLNKVQFIGHLGRDPEVRYTQSGAAVCSFSVASTERYKDKNTGEQVESTEWLSCVAWNQLGEICGEYLRSGSLVYVEGKLKTRKYQDKDGQDRYKTEAVLDTMRMLGPRQDGGDGYGQGQGDGYGRQQRQQPQQGRQPARQAPQGRAPGGNQGRAPQSPQSRQTAPARAPAPSTGFDDMDDDIPF